MASIQTGNQAGIESPPGTIVIFVGLLANIPIGWSLCDGTGGTPDLRDRFERQVPTSGTNPGATGGLATVPLTTGQMGSHIHTISGSSHRHDYPVSSISGGGSEGQMVIGGNDGTQTALDFNDTQFVKVFDPVQTQGGNGSHNNIPTFLEVLFIQKD